MAEFKGLKADLMIIDDLPGAPVVAYDLTVKPWQKDMAGYIATEQPVWAFKGHHIGVVSVPPPLDPEIKAALPDVCRRAAKRISNQPVLWCKRAFHKRFGKDYDDQPRDWLGRFVALDELPKHEQACAMGHIEDILTEDFGAKAFAKDGLAVRQASNEINKASQKATGLFVPAANDHEDATPETIADHLYVVADELEFGDG